MKKYTTVHYALKNGHIDIEVTDSGEVVGVWYGQLMLPFSIEKVGSMRGEHMKEFYLRKDACKIIDMTAKTSN